VFTVRHAVVPRIDKSGNQPHACPFNYWRPLLPGGEPPRFPFVCINSPELLAVWIRNRYGPMMTATTSISLKGRSDATVVIETMLIIHEYLPETRNLLDSQQHCQYK